jgi:hypothetical protein
MPLAGVAAAQERRPAAMEFSAGSMIFVDDGFPNEGTAGGTGLFYLSPRVAIGPEFAFVQGRNHRHYMITGNVTFEFFGPAGGRSPLVTPFVVAGGGIFHTRDRTPRGGFNSSDGAFTVGGGVRVFAGERLYAGAEARIGWEPHLRMNGLVGWRF